MEDAFDEVSAEENEAPATDAPARGRGRGRKSGGKAGGKNAAAKNQGKGRGKGVIKPHVKECFISGCNEKLRSKSRFCHKHHKDVEGIKYQAKVKNDPEVSEAVEAAFSDPQKARLAVDEFERQNPEGRFRKRLIDWSAFKQSFGKRAEVRHRGEEELMDVTDFVMHKQKRGMDEEAAMNEWKKLLESDADREGEGLDVKIWVVMNKKRFRDNITYKDDHLEEGSRQAKDMSDADRQVLLVASMASYCFIPQL